MDLSEDEGKQEFNLYPSTERQPAICCQKVPENICDKITLAQKDRKIRIYRSHT